MSRQETRTLQQKIRSIVNQQAQPVTRQAFLATSYIGYSREVLVSLGDPASGRGALVRATFQPGVVTGEIPEDTPVLVICRHGRFEITGLRIG